MFEITRRNPLNSPIRELMEFMTNDPFLRGTTSLLSEEGTLPLDVAEEGGDIVVRASLPGFRKEDIDVQIHNGVLSIKADHAEETETKDEHYYRRERRVGSVSRRIALPGVVSEATANAELKDGILTLRIPQAEVAKPKQIKIK
jgi:HSP20 family protein